MTDVQPTIEAAQSAAETYFPFEALPSELQSDIFNRLDGRSLVAALLVNKSWGERCVELIWRSPPLNRLVAINPIATRQFYATKVHTLKFYGSRFCSDLDRLSFLSLREVHFHGRFSRAVRLLPYLQKTLRTISFGNYPLTADALDLIRAYCPNLRAIHAIGTLNETHSVGFAGLIGNSHSLRDLHVDGADSSSAVQEILACTNDAFPSRLEELTLYNNTDTLDSMTFYEFLRKCRSLHKLCLKSKVNGRLITDDIMAYLSRLDSLECMALILNLERDVIYRFLRRFPHQRPLQNLKQLVLQGGSSSVVPLLYVTSEKLRELAVFVDDTLNNLCGCIGSLKNLTSLELDLKERHIIITSDFEALASLRSLTQLSITHNIVHRVRSVPTLQAQPVVPWVDDDRFKQWISNFPLLESLNLECNFPLLTSKSVESLASACPLLTHCGIWWSHDLNTWKFDTTFPELEVLHLGKITGCNFLAEVSDTDARMEAWVQFEMISAITPRLKNFAIMDQSGSVIAIKTRR